MGSSSCTPIAVQFAVTFLRALALCSYSGSGEQRNITPNIYELMTEATLEGISSYSAIAGDTISAYSTTHLSVEEYMIQAPHLTTLLRKTGGPYQHLLTETGCFRSMFQQAVNELNASNMSPSSSSIYMAIIITKPPETVVVFIPVGSRSTSVESRLSYYLFDSHSRPQLGIEGSYVVKCGTEAALISRLKSLFPPLMDGDGVGEEENYMTWMYNSFEGLAFILPSDEFVGISTNTSGDTGGFISAAVAEHRYDALSSTEEEKVSDSVPTMSPSNNHTTKTTSTNTTTTLTTDGIDNNYNSNINEEEEEYVIV